ncbi:thermoresistant gluconokinase [Thozetella sp. PMI_491]|nr:thermoresistant gluconokinase [Thozetella sp. PMI_491]
MISCDSPISVNGKVPASPTLSAGRQSVPASPKLVRQHVPAMQPAVPNGTAHGAVHTNGHRSPREHHIWLVTGPAGCGKTTVAEHISRELNLPYVEGDQFHPPANIEKMSNGIPLTDADRWDWLTLLRDEALARLNAGHEGVVVTCSALKRKYRDVIRVAGYYDPNLHLHFIYLNASEEVLLRRVQARQNHYMGANMVHSQFEALEPPTAAEKDVITVDVDKSPEEVMAEALAKVLQVRREEALAE